MASVGFGLCTYFDAILMFNLVAMRESLSRSWRSLTRTRVMGNFINSSNAGTLILNVGMNVIKHLHDSQWIECNRCIMQVEQQFGDDNFSVFG